MSLEPIRYILREEVDIGKWDSCIERASNGLIYAYSFYLDQMAKRWDALIMGDYEWVMPVTWNKKFGIHYLYQPPFTASLGVFGIALTEEIVSYFLRSIPAKYRLIEISLNAGNIFSYPSGFSLIRNNYTLALNKSYDELYKNYRENTRRNIKRAQQVGVHYQKDISITDVIDLSKQKMQTLSRIKDSDYTQFEKLYHLLKKKKSNCLRSISFRSIGSLCSLFFFTQ